jgi:YD repeat-containing protein
MLITSNGQRHWQNYFRRDLVVTLDGVVQQDVLEADDEAGFVVRYQRDESGRFVRDADGTRLVTERIEGTVVFAGTRMPDAKAAAADKRARRKARNCRIQNRADVRTGGVA